MQNRTPQIDLHHWQQRAWQNRVQSVLLLTAMGGFLAILGWLLWGIAGIAVLLGMGIGAVLANPSFSPRWVMHMYGAAPISPAQAPALWDALRVLSHRAGLAHQPALYYIPSRTLNAFAVGNRDNAALAVSDGLLRRLNLRELIGVLAHETSHIRNNDLWVMGLADMFSRATSVLSLLGQLLVLVNLPLLLFTDVSMNWYAIALLLLAPTLSALAQLALSRTREFDADLNAARITGDPQGLASALAKIERTQGGWMERILLPGRKVPEPSLLRTHPDTGARIDRLLSLTSPAPEFPLHGLGPHQIPYGDAHVSRTPRWHLTGLWH